MKSFIKQYLQYSRREKNGIFLLLFVLAGLIILNYTIPYWAFTKSSNKKSYAELFGKADSTTATDSTFQQLPTNTEEPLKINFAFNPNTTSFDSMVLAGLPEKLAQQIVNYRTKGGKFRVKKDFAKLYYLKGEMYAAIEPFLLLPDKSDKAAEKPIIVEINSADSLQLLAVKGLGPYYTYKIIKYRDQLGGFYTLDQLGEAFTINANSLDEQQKQMAFIKTQLRVNVSKIKKLNINTATQKQLTAHPYIGYKESKAIVRYREKNGRIQNFDDLKNITALSPKTIELITNYIEF